MSTKNFDEPFIIKGGLSVDDRGEVLFVNDFFFKQNANSK